jgi:hypothetical protein
LGALKDGSVMERKFRAFLSKVYNDQLIAPDSSVLAKIPLRRKTTDTNPQK